MIIKFSISLTCRLIFSVHERGERTFMRTKYFFPTAKGTLKEVLPLLPSPVIRCKCQEVELSSEIGG